MGPNIVFMIPILAISVGLVAVIGNTIIRPLLIHRERRLEIGANKIAEMAAHYAAQNERLEQRLRVLERIVTDRGIDVANEIEKLRDEPAQLN